MTRKKEIDKILMEELGKKEKLEGNADEDDSKEVKEKTEDVEEKDGSQSDSSFETVSFIYYS